MMDFAEEFAKRKGYRSIRLDAFDENPRALEIYEARHYRRAGPVIFRNRKFSCFEKQIA